jgi:hypothetical protein
MPKNGCVTEAECLQAQRDQRHYIFDSFKETVMAIDKRLEGMEIKIDALRVSFSQKADFSHIIKLWTALIILGFTFASAGAWYLIDQSNFKQEMAISQAQMPSKVAQEMLKYFNPNK